MAGNYLRFLKKTLARNPLFSIINIVGLSIGIAACILATFFIKDELSYDRQSKDADRIFRIVTDMVNGAGYAVPEATTPPAIAASLQRNIPEVVASTRLFHSSESSFFVRSEKMKFLERNILHVDSNFFDFFHSKFIQGNPETALQESHSVILTSSSAKRYFANENPIGKTIQIDDFDPGIVTAVVADPPTNMHFTYSLLCLNARFLQRESWDWSAFYTYVKLQKGANIVGVNEKIAAVVKREAGEIKSHFLLQPLTSIHLDSDRKSELMPNSDSSYLYIIGSLGFLILFIACANFVNLSTAQSSLRAKEIGIRKVSGAKRETLIGQFLLESVFISLLAAVVAIVLAWRFLPILNEFSGKSLTFADSWLRVGCWVLIFSVILGILSGLYPAFYISSFRPSLVLKGSKMIQPSGFSLRKTLVISQFAMSIALIVGTIVARRQIDFIQNSRLGFNKENVLVVTVPYYLSDEVKVLKDEWLRIPGVVKVSVTNGVIPDLTWDQPIIAPDSKKEQLLRGIMIDSDYLSCLGIPLIQGSMWTIPRDTGNTGEVILNETAIAQLNLKEPIIGQILDLPKNDKRPKSFLRIRGVVKDFHFSSFRSAIEPLAFIKIRKLASNFAVKIQGSNALVTIKSIEKIWNKNINNWPFQYRFLDETFAKLYKAETNFSKIFFYLTVIAIFTACLGLVGLSTFTTNQRVKEIGIRKVLGSSATQIFRLLLSDFGKLVVIAAFISIPVSGWMMSQWLQRFAYHISIQWWFFVVAGSIALVVALASISFQVVKAALVNPITALREE
jgi:putative ABC transport system permease protein